jgi:hypothetical protein
MHVETTIRAVAFDGDTYRIHRVRVDLDWTVRVWDPVAGYFTAAHALPSSAQDRARMRARRVMAETITDDEIKALRDEAIVHGDRHLCRIALSALDGSPAARAACWRAIAEARAQVSA